jgi:hypothetical protein
MKFRPVGDESLHADGQTDMTLIVALRNSEDASKNRLHPVHQTEQFGLCIRFTFTCLSYDGYNSNQSDTLLKQILSSKD